MKIETVLCPIDFTPVSRRGLDAAVEVCRTFGARLVLHHHRHEAPPGFSREWDWDHEHRGGEREGAERRLQAIIRDLPEGISAQAKVSRGNLVASLTFLAEQLPVDLLVMGSHGWGGEEHESVAERLLAKGRCPLLALHEDQEPFTLDGGDTPNVLVATDLSPDDASAAYALRLAATLSLRLHLLHVLSPGAPEAARAEAERHLGALVPPGTHAEVVPHVRDGDPVEVILAVAAELQPRFMVAGEHARRFLQRYLTRDTARELLHRAPCPVWFVPPGHPVSTA